MNELYLTDDTTYQDESSDSIEQGKTTPTLSRKRLGPRSLSSISVPTTGTSEAKIATLTIPVPNLHEADNARSKSKLKKYLNVPREV